jgi:hypothetical protein
MYRSKVQQKTGVFSPVTGQAVVVQTTCVDDSHADDVRRAYKNSTAGRYRLPKDDLTRRVESHLLALKKKGRSRWVKGSGADLKIFTMLNGMTKDDINQLTHVGIVQTPINPDDKTKPQGFRTNATRIGGTASMINTGTEAIPPNSCIYWDFPELVKGDEVSQSVKDAQSIRGHPEGAIYPEIKVYDVMNEAEEIAGRRGDVKTNALAVLQKQQRIIGWSTNHAEPGCQLDVILKR